MKISEMEQQAKEWEGNYKNTDPPRNKILLNKQSNFLYLKEVEKEEDTAQNSVERMK